MPLTIRRRLVDRVRQWRKIAYVACAALVVLAVAVVFLSVSAPASSIEVFSGSTFFDPDRALRTARYLDDVYHDRYLGSPSDDATTVINWLVEKYTRPPIQVPEKSVLVDEFKVPLGNKEVTLRNVAVVLQGPSKETILVTAPRDTPPIVKVDHLAYASGTAILVDLAQVFSSRPHQKTFIFLSTEDIDNGALSIGRFLDTYADAGNVTTILSIHGLGKEDTQALKAGVTGSQSVTPGWYLQLAAGTLGKAGLDLEVPGILSQAADQALSLSHGDQVAGLGRRIASLALYDDGPGNPTSAGLATQGAAIERLILSLDSGTEAPPDPGTALLLTSGRFLTNRAVGFLALLMLLPAAAALLIWLFTSRITGKVALRHLRNFFSFALPLAWIFLLAFLFSRFGLIPRYDLEVPAVSGPATQPRLAPTLLLILLGGAAFAGSRHFLGYLRPREQRATTEMARLSTGFLGLLVGLALVLFRSPFLILPCLAAAWAWPLATCFAEPVYTGAVWRHRFTSNAPVLLSGLIAPILLYAYIASADGVGWTGAWWYVLVKTVSGSYGFLGPAAFVLITASFLTLLGARRMRVVPIETLEVTDELSLLELPVPRSRRKPRNPTRPPLSPWG
ncbi:MAG: hypothetical protein M1274_07755 [Actinobacteria bacterium]|nr:hypothetical protein [Actinomycetota bacterium]